MERVTLLFIFLVRRNKALINKSLKKFAMLSTLLLVGLSSQVFAQQWSMGYWTGYDGDPESALDWKAITHLIHWATVHQNTNGTLNFLCSGGVSCSQSEYITYASGIIAGAHANNVKVILGLSDPNFSAAISSGLSPFVSNIMAVVNGAGYDGVDIDWEVSPNWTQYASLLTALRSSLRSKSLTGTTFGENNSFWATQTKNGVADRVNFMTYDMEGGGSPYSWFNSALYSDTCDCVLSWDLDRSRIVSAGVPPSKLNMGIPFYGYLETGVIGPRGGGQSGATQMNYKTAATRYNLSNATYDGVSHEPWITVSSSSWLGIENSQSVIDKVNYVKAQGLGGWIIFNLSGDYLPSKNPAHPLMAAIADAMGTSSASH
jgi:chitinase